jgi:hypothetical protein
MKFVRETPQEWCIQGTPYTTCTVNDTYPTGVHQDAGDLDEGFSCLTVARRGSYTGGFLTFPRYEVAVDMQDGDLILMNAHDWHGNTAMQCECGTPLGHSEGLKGTGPCKACGAQRISVVLYYRTNMARCGTQEQEQEKAIQRADALNAGPQAPAQDRSVTPAPPIPTLSPEQRAAEAKAYRESRGEPEPLTLG